MPLTIALDGPVGAGKSSIADAVAGRLGILHLDTGAMYRALGLTALERGIDCHDEEALAALCKAVRVTVELGANGQRTLADGRDVTGLIRTPEVSMAASDVAKVGAVRRHMVALQQELAERQPMLLDGRDIGTRVLPNATVKIFLTAEAEERARRRMDQMLESGQQADFETILADVKKRDEQDMNRAVDPLRAADDAKILDSTELDFDQVVDTIVAMVKEAEQA